MTNKDQPQCFLFDNGSFRAAATLGLRTLAGRLTPRLGVTVRPVSLLHSTRVPAAELDGRPAELLEPALREFLQRGGRKAILLPLFFGPSGALVEYVPERVAALRAEFPAAEIRLARELVDPGDAADTRVAKMLADAVLHTVQAKGLATAQVLLTDHGTPLRTVSEVRNHLGRQLRACLDPGDFGSVGVASMERREGADYDFNEPLLEHALATSPFDEGDVVIALQFLQPGRHAGPGGDVATICQAAEARVPGKLRTHMTRPLGTADERLVGLLADRWDEARLKDSAVLSARYRSHSA